MLEHFNDDAAVHNLAGATFLAAGDVDAASIHLRLAQEIDPELLMPKLNIARLERMRGESASAEAQYRSVLQQFPQSTIANIELAKLLAESGDRQEALERVTAILRVDPTLFDAHELKLRLFQHERSDPERTRSAIYEVLKTFPDDPKADLLAGRIYRKIRDLEDAKVHFRRAVQKAHFDTDILYTIANQQFGIRDFRGALWTLTKAEQGSPGLSHIGVLKAGVLVQLRELDKAKEEIDKLTEKHGTKASIQTVAGDYYMAVGNRQEAAKSYLTAFETVSNFKTAQTYFRSLVAANDVETASAFIEKWIAEHPQHLGSKHLYAQLLMMREQWAEAQKLYEALQERGTEDLILLNNLASCYQHLGDPRALPTAEAAYNLAPKNAQVADTYGWILTEHGRTDEGLAVLREAFARASTSPEIRYHIGLALAQLGRTAEASEEVEAALAANERFSARDEATSLLERLRDALK